VDEDKGSPDVTNQVSCSRLYPSDYGNEFFNMTSIANVDEVTAITVYLYCFVQDTDQGTPCTKTVNIDLGGFQGTKNISTGGTDWQDFTWSGLSGSQSDLDSLVVRLYSGEPVAGKILGDNIQIYTIYATVTYTGGSGYGNNFNGVASANIGKISGVATANIDKVKGA
jgi:hypothetical protein